MWVAFANAKATHIFFSKNSSIYAIFNDQSFSDNLTNDIVSFEQLGPVKKQRSGSTGDAALSDKGLHCTLIFSSKSNNSLNGQ